MDLPNYSTEGIWFGDTPMHRFGQGAPPREWAIPGTEEEGVRLGLQAPEPSCELWWARWQLTGRGGAGGWCTTAGISEDGQYGNPLAGRNPDLPSELGFAYPQVAPKYSSRLGLRSEPLGYRYSDAIQTNAARGRPMCGSLFECREERLRRQRAGRGERLAKEVALAGRSLRDSNADVAEGKPRLSAPTMGLASVSRVGPERDLRIINA